MKREPSEPYESWTFNKIETEFNDHIILASQDFGDFACNPSERVEELA